MKKMKEMVIKGKFAARNFLSGKMKGDSKLIVEILLIVIAAALIVLYRGKMMESFNSLFNNISDSFNSVIS